jgi:hypothetical protein
VLRSRSYRAPIVSGDCLNATSRANNTWQSSSAHLGALVFDKTCRKTEGKMPENVRVHYRANDRSQR